MDVAVAGSAVASSSKAARIPNVFMLDPTKFEMSTRECPQRDRLDLKFQGVRQEEIDEIPVKET
jgi:hypothetical protein